MTKQWLTHFNDVPLALIGFLLFFCLFILALLWVFRKNSGLEYKKISQLPLNDEKNLGDVL